MNTLLDSGCKLAGFAASFGNVILYVVRENVLKNL